MFAVSYFLGGTAFLADIFRDGFNEVTITILINGLYMATLLVLIASLAIHFSKPIPYRYLGIMASVSMLGMAWFLLVDYNVTYRTAWMNFGSGLLLLSTLSMVPHKNCATIYKFIYWVLVVTFLQFFIRTTLTIYLPSDPLTMENYRTSAYLVAFNFTITLASMSLALTLCVAVAMEEISNMQRLLETDPLSGLINRRGFEQEAEERIAIASTRKVPLCLIVCDIDHFKNVNDKYGHAFGDKVIKVFGSILKGACRRTDLVARVGGEEFCMLLPVATKEMGLLVANSAREHFMQHAFSGIPSDTRFTASFGVAQIEPGDTYGDLFKRADEALYEAKNSGRNKAVVSGAYRNQTKVVGMRGRSNRSA